MQKYVIYDIGHTIREFRTDNGEEFINDEVENFLSKTGIRHQLTVPHFSSQNDVSEKKN